MRTTRTPLVGRRGTGSRGAVPGSRGVVLGGREAGIRGVVPGSQGVVSGGREAGIRGVVPGRVAGVWGVGGRAGRGLRVRVGERGDGGGVASGPWVRSADPGPGGRAAGPAVPPGGARLAHPGLAGPGAGAVWEWSRRGPHLALTRGWSLALSSC